MAINASGDLFEAICGTNTINEFTPGGTKSVFATGLYYPIVRLAFSPSGNLFEDGHRHWQNLEIHARWTESCSPAGTSTSPTGLACHASGNLFVADYGTNAIGTGEIVEFTPSGSESVFAKRVRTRSTWQFLLFPRAFHDCPIKCRGCCSNRLLLAESACSTATRKPRLDFQGALLTGCRVAEQNEVLVGRRSRTGIDFGLTRTPEPTVVRFATVHHDVRPCPPYQTRPSSLYLLSFIPCPSSFRQRQHHRPQNARRARTSSSSGPGRVRAKAVERLVVGKVPGRRCDRSGRRPAGLPVAAAEPTATWADDHRVGSASSLRQAIPSRRGGSSGLNGVLHDRFRGFQAAVGDIVLGLAAGRIVLQRCILPSAIA